MRSSGYKEDGEERKMEQEELFLFSVGSRLPNFIKYDRDIMKIIFFPFFYKSGSLQPFSWYSLWKSLIRIEENMI